MTTDGPSPLSSGPGCLLGVTWSGNFGRFHPIQPGHLVLRISLQSEDEVTGPIGNARPEGEWSKSYPGLTQGAKERGALAIAWREFSLDLCDLSF